MACRTAETLFKHFVEATKHHVEAAELLANLVGSRACFAEARLRVEEAYAECKAAHSALQAHRKHHNCCAAPSPEEANPSDEPRVKQTSVAGR